MSEIILDGVSKVFDDGFEAVKEMNLEIADGADDAAYADLVAARLAGPAGQAGDR